MINRITLLQILGRLTHEPSESLESDTLEFKHYSSESSLHNAKDLTEEISALANHEGGIILVGVRDSKNVLFGAWPDQLAGFSKVDLNTTRERLRGKIKPFIELELCEVEHAGKNYLEIRIPHCRHSLVATASGKVCIRDGKSSRPMTPEEIQHAVKNLQDYDWSSETIEELAESTLNRTAVQEAMADFCSRREIPELDQGSFFEAIGVTKNGLLTKSGLLFLGTSQAIRDHLGGFEYRFSRKTGSGELLLNDVWEDCLWETIKRARAHFNHCNSVLPMTFEGKEYSVQFLDSIAFHEAYLNALVHRDYTVDGMVSVNFTGDRLIITSPGAFYGGVTPENIARHEPRHRNKALAKMLMEYHLVDRAGMGVLRMSINSLKYGRAFPSFVERGSSIEVTMQGEFFRPPVFVLATSEGANMGIPELLILNSVYEAGVVPVHSLAKQLAKVVGDPWGEIQRAVTKLPQVELCGARTGVFVRVKPDWNKFFKVTKFFKLTSASSKYVSLYLYLMTHGSASNADIKVFLGLKHTSQTSAFLKSAGFVRRVGQGSTSVWEIAERN